jgi:hypothetical protein
MASSQNAAPDQRKHQLTLEYARELDGQDSLARFRDEFVIPTKSDLKRTRLVGGEQILFQQN